MKHDWDSCENAFNKFKASPPAHWANYLGFYSSWLGGFFREPWAMTLPLDDHGFHRGDGVFEAVRIHERAYFDLHAHLHRLENSAAAIGMQLPKTHAEIVEICVRLARLCDIDQGILRLYVTRGPGSFSPSPYEVVGAQIYAAITRLRTPDPEIYVQGCKAMMSSVVAKEQRWSQIKSCNYLQNVLMKKECHEKGFDLAISVDEQGRVCEGATENLLIITAEKRLIVPSFDYTLRGTTVSVVMSIAQNFIKEGRLRSVELADLSVEDVFAAEEVSFVGTTLGVLPVRQVGDRVISKGYPGPLTVELNNLLMHKMATDAQLRFSF